jgi:hypothetical protein
MIDRLRESGVTEMTDTVFPTAAAGFALFGERSAEFKGVKIFEGVDMKDRGYRDVGW